MNILSIEEFKKLISLSSWTHHRHTEVVADHPNITYAFTQIASRLGPFVINAYQGFNWDTDDLDKSDVRLDVLGVDEPVELQGFRVVDGLGLDVESETLMVILCGTPFQKADIDAV